MRAVWLVDQTLGDIAEMLPLLGRYGTAIDISGSSRREASAILAAYKAAGLVSFFDAGLVLPAETAEHVGLPLHSPRTAALLVDKLRQPRRWRRPAWRLHAGLRWRSSPRRDPTRSRKR